MRLSLFLSILRLALATQTKRAEPAPLIIRADGIADKYIVKFHDSSLLSVLDDAISKLSSNADHVFKGSFKGFAGKLDEATLQILRDHPDVDYIEQDNIATVSGYITQKNSPWGLGRISHRNNGSTDYVYDESAGKGACVYVVDTGVDDTHPEFEGRAKQVKSFIDGQEKDGDGHGTHCSGTVGSKTYGVAKKTNIYGIKVLDNDGNGSYSSIIAGLEYVSEDVANRDCPNGVVVSMSLGGSFSQAMNDAAAAAIRKGYFLAAAAGNMAEDAKNHSPGSEPSVCTVGGSAIDDKPYTKSNHGPLVDIIAPAVDVFSTLPNNTTGSLTGTSMATPHIAGLAAYLAVLNGEKVGPQYCDRIRNMATQDAISNHFPNTVNLLAFNGNPSA